MAVDPASQGYYQVDILGNGQLQWVKNVGTQDNPRIEVFQGETPQQEATRLASDKGLQQYQRIASASDIPAGMGFAGTDSKGQMYAAPLSAFAPRTGGANFGNDFLPWSGAGSNAAGAGSFNDDGGLGYGALVMFGGPAIGAGGTALAGAGAGAGATAGTTGTVAASDTAAAAGATGGAAGTSGGGLTASQAAGLTGSGLSAATGSESLIGNAGSDTVTADGGDFSYDPGAEGTYNTPTTPATTIYPNGIDPGIWEQAKSLLQQGKSALDIGKMLGLDATQMKTLGSLASTGLGIYASQQQQDEFRRLADQYASYGAPYRERLSKLYADPSSFLTSPEVTVPVQQASDMTARSLSVGGNPIGSGNALQKLQSFSADQLFGRLGQEKDRLAGFGGLTAYNAAAPGAATNAINAGANTFNAAGSGISNIFSPPQTLAQQMAEFQRLSRPVQ